MGDEPRRHEVTKRLIAAPRAAAIRTTRLQRLVQIGNNYGSSAVGEAPLRAFVSSWFKSLLRKTEEAAPDISGAASVVFTTERSRRSSGRLLIARARRRPRRAWPCGPRARLRTC